MSTASRFFEEDGQFGARSFQRAARSHARDVILELLRAAQAGLDQAAAETPNVDLALEPESVKFATCQSGGYLTSIKCPSDHGHINKVSASLVRNPLEKGA